MAAKLGAQVSMVTKLGRDVFARGRSELPRPGHRHDLRHVDDSRFSGVAPIFVDDRAQNFIVIVPGANLGLTPDDCAQGARRDPCCRPARLPAGGAGRDNLGSVPHRQVRWRAHHPQSGAGRADHDELLGLADICAPNETETELLTGMPVQTLADAETAARHCWRGARAP